MSFNQKIKNSQFCIQRLAEPSVCINCGLERPKGTWWVFKTWSYLPGFLSAKVAPYEFSGLEKLIMEEKQIGKAKRNDLSNLLVKTKTSVLPSQLRSHHKQSEKGKETTFHFLATFLFKF